jgi:hypothetical protein
MASILRFDNWQNSDGTSIATTDASGNISFAGSGAGKILQVVSTTKTDTFSASVAQGTSTPITGLSVTITPNSASSNILVIGQINGSSDGASEAAVTVLTRNGAAICVGDAAGSRSLATSGSGYTSSATGYKESPYSIGILFLDSPATTSSTTYAVEIGSTFFGTSGVFVNTGPNTTLDRSDVWRTTSSITVMEVSA